MDKRKKDRRVSVGETLGVRTPDLEGTNLTESRSLDSVLAAVCRLNDMSADPQKNKKGRSSKKWRSSVALTEALFVSASDEEKERDVDGDLIPNSVSMSGISSEPMSSRSSSEDEGEDVDDDSREVKENRDIPETGEPESHDPVAPAPPAGKPSREENTPTPSDSAEPHLSPRGPKTAVKECPKTKPVISLVSTSTSESAGENLKEMIQEIEDQDTSVITTPDRQPEVPDTEDRRFIKPDDEEESEGDDRESDPDYELTEASISPSGLGCADSPTPVFEEERTETMGEEVERQTTVTDQSAAESEKVSAQLEVLKTQRVLEAKERLDKEVQKRADEMYTRRLAIEEARSSFGS